MKEENDINVLTRRQEDGRVQCLSKMKNGKYFAAFNRFPYRFEEITEKQFEMYKTSLKYVPFNVHNQPQIEEYYDGNYDNGLPKFINWLF